MIHSRVGTCSNEWRFGMHPSADQKNGIANQRERAMKKFLLEIKCKRCSVELLCIPQLDDDELIICRNCRSVGRMREANSGQNMRPGTVTEKELEALLADIGL